ncbi:MAG: DNA helicase RecQ [Aestuariivirgaceae bacterium]
MSSADQILKDVFGFDDFRPGQKDVVETILAGRNVLAVMPTGSGKSLCYQVPALVRGGVAIVVSPLVALMQDQVAGLKLTGVAAATINSSQDYQTNADIWRSAVSGELKLLYVSPERLMKPDMLAALEQLPISLFAIDEAHCISQWGAAFRPEYEMLSQLSALFPKVSIAAFTASADEVTRHDIAEKLFGGGGDVFVHGFDRPNIQLKVAAKNNWKAQLLEFVNQHRGENGIVYCLSRKKTEQTAALLNENGHKALAYHAGMGARDRQDNQNRFMSETGLIIVATIAFGMGVDKADVRFVFHTDLPGSIEAYYQEFGRAGRDGAPAEACMLYGLDDLRMRRVFIEDEGGDEARKRREHKRLDALIAYCESPACRRVALLDYFGEASGPCGNCDVCLDPGELQDGLIEGQKILSAVYRTGQMYGSAHITDVLRGTATEKVTRARHDQLPTFGVGAELSRRAWSSLIRQLVASGFLQIDIKGYGGLSITEKGRALLKGAAEFNYRPVTLGQTRKPAARAKSVPRDPAIDVSTLDASANDLLTRLKALRYRLASERGVPAYVIFHDRTLIDMASKAPRSADELAGVHGVGAAKLESFGDLFLEEIHRGQEEGQQAAG